jgi:hypothetical protein
MQAVYGYKEARIKTVRALIISNENPDLRGEGLGYAANLPLVVWYAWVGEV